MLKQTVNLFAPLAENGYEIENPRQFLTAQAAAFGLTVEEITESFQGSYDITVSGEAPNLLAYNAHIGNIE